MSIFKRLIEALFYKFLANYSRPLYSKFAYDLAKKYVFFYQGDLSTNLSLNGEARIIKYLAGNHKIRTVFDVGANVGDYTAAVLKVDPTIEIHVFEPSKTLFSKLINRYNRSNMKLNNLALGSARGRKKLYVNDQTPELNSFYQVKVGRRPHNREEQVRVITLDTYCQDNVIDHIDLLKIDTEGHDLEVLKGAERMIRKSHIDIIQFEFGLPDTYSRTLFLDFLDFFTAHNYEVYKIKPQKLERVVYTEEMEKCLYANFVAARRGSTLDLI